jgi:DNA-binding transcriptional ArsR family regulator
MAGKRGSAAARRSEAIPSARRAGLHGSPSVHRTFNLDRLIHDRTRLAIVSALAVNDTLTFTELKTLTETTDGNLSVHARKLEEAGYVRCTKGFEGRMPKTEFALTDAGRAALRRYLDHMEAIIRHARAKAR